MVIRNSISAGSTFSLCFFFGGERGARHLSDSLVGRVHLSKPKN